MHSVGERRTTRKPHDGSGRRRLVGRLCLAAALAMCLGGAHAVGISHAAPTWQWYRADVHVHSSGVSPDAAQDLGVMSQAAKAQGLNAIFLTDHGAGSNQPIASAIANHIVLGSTFSYWKTALFGTVSSSTDAFDTSHVVPGGTNSLHLAATSSGYGEAITWYKRGPNLRSGDLVLKFSVYPTRIDAGSGIYVSAAIGGDSTLKDATGSGCDSTSGKGGPPNGYTTSAGVISPGKSNVFVWQLGTPRSASSDPNARVFTQQLSYTLNTWNTYTIDITQALNQIPAADRPDDYNALEALKIVAAANNGTADAYVGNYHLDAGTPVPSGDEFVHRNSIIHTYDTSTFATFPGLEAGSSQHVSRFNYGITSASQYQYYSTGPPSIPDTHATGYPAQLDHPALPGGVTQQAAIANKGYGADLMETVPRGTNEAMITTWDGILEQGVQLIGTWSSDAHRTETFGDSTAIWAPSLTFDPLIRSLYEGRLYMAQNSFTGRLLFGPDSAPQEPYPARYPIFVSPSASTANLTLDISGGLSGGTVEWVQEGTKVATDPVAGSTYHATKPISLATLPTYVRTQARTSSTKAIVTMSEPIFFEGVTGLPKDMTFHVAGVTTTDGEHYENVDLKGITAEQWSANALDLTLVNPAGSLVETVASTGGFTPSAVTVDGHAVSAASSLSAYDGATSSSWFFDSATRTLHVKATQGAATGTDLRVSFTGSTDTQPPSTPGNLQQTGATTTSISLGWNASNDNVGVSHYDVKLDGQLAASPTGTSTTITGLTCGTSHSITVVAVDGAGNTSSPASLTAATAQCPPTTTLTPVADAYVDASSASTNFGSSTKLRVDSSPDVRSYLRFDLTGISGVTSATLRVFATSALTAGYDVHGVSDTSWGESTLNYGNAPAFDAAVAGSSGTVVASSYSSVDVTSAVHGGGLISLALTAKSATALGLDSRESGATTTPQLIVTTAGGGDTQAPSVPTNLHSTGATTTTVSLAWTASTDNVGVDHYIVDVDGNAAGQPSSTTFTAGGLACGTAHTFDVRAVDAAGNTSAPTATIGASTSACQGDTQPPSAPTQLQATATTQTSISLAWTASTDDVGVAGYRVYDGTTLVASPTNTNVAITGLTCGTPHSFTVVAFDAAGNVSSPSGALPVSTAACGGGTTLTFTPVADAYVDSSVPSTNFGANAKLRVDTSPDVRSYLRFNVTGLTGPVQQVTLRIFATSGLAAGYDVRGVADTTWGESTITYANAPLTAATVTGSSGPVTLSTWTTVDVTPLITANGVFSIALTGRSTTALALTSKETTATPPQLVVNTS